jgi:hypothetical protein
MLLVTVGNNISVTVSLYFLYLFYEVLQRDLEPFSPWSKVQTLLKCHD